MHLFWIIFLSVYLLFLFLSILFFIFPQLIHKPHLTFAKRKFQDTTKKAIFSHRGGALEAPENSMASFRHSINNNITGIELDVYKTKDNVFVTTHDRSLRRLTGQNALISDLNYSEIDEFSPEIDSHLGIYTLKENEVDEKPARFEDLLKLAQHGNILLNIDVKSGEEDITDVLALTKQYNITDRIIIGYMIDFKTDSLREQFGSEINFFFPAKQVFFVLLFFIMGILPFVPLKYDFYETTFAFEEIMKSEFLKERWFIRCLLGFIRCLWPVTTLLNWHLKRRGIVVLYWTVNNKNDCDMAFKLGGQGILTDRPSELKNYLVNKGLF